jgi:hypothetical protein
LILTFLLGLATISTDDLRKEFPVLRRDQAIVSDAITRWAGGNPKAMEERVPIVVHFRDKRCVVLYLRPPSLGGDAIFCYDDGDKLIEAFANWQ